jgi:hypothetical protein
MSFAIVCACGGLLYFRRVQLPRPPLGVFGTSDVLIIFVMIILVPFLYVVLPVWGAFILLSLAFISILTSTLHPLFRHRTITWGVTLLLFGGNIAVWHMLGVTHPMSQLLNNSLIVIVVIGTVNTWAQAGMKAPHAVLLGVLLIVYDYIATAQTSMMGDVMQRLNALPFAPMLAWGEGHTAAVLGLGDLLMVTLFPLVMLKGFGRSAGVLSLAIGICVLLALPLVAIGTLFPVMVVLGPVMLLQYLAWVWHQHKIRGGSRLHTNGYFQSAIVN